MTIIHRKPRRFHQMNHCPDLTVGHRAGAVAAESADKCPFWDAATWARAFGMARFADTPARSVLNVTRLAAAMWY